MIPSPKLFKKKPICSQAEWFFPLRSSLVCRKKCSIIFLRCCFIKKQYYLINIHNMQHEILLKNLLKISLPISWLVTKAVIGPVSHKLVVPFAMLLDNNLPLLIKWDEIFISTRALFLLVAISMGAVSWLEKVGACTHLELSVNLIISIRMIWSVIAVCARDGIIFTWIYYILNKILQMYKMYRNCTILLFPLPSFYMSYTTQFTSRKADMLLVFILL